MVDSNINEIIAIDPQAQLPAYIELQGMDQVRSIRIVNLHVIGITHSVTGCGRGSNLCFSKSHQYKPYK